MGRTFESCRGHYSIFDFGFRILDCIIWFRWLYAFENLFDCRIEQFKVRNRFMAAIVQRLERLIVVQDVMGSNPISRPIILSF